MTSHPPIIPRLFFLVGGGEMINAIVLAITLSLFLSKSRTTSILNLNIAPPEINMAPKKSHKKNLHSEGFQPKIWVWRQMGTKVTWYLSQTLKNHASHWCPLCSLITLISGPQKKSWSLRLSHDIFLNTMKQKWHDYLGDDEMFCTKPCFFLHGFNLSLELTTPFPKASFGQVPLLVGLGCVDQGPYMGVNSNIWWIWNRAPWSFERKSTMCSWSKGWFTSKHITVREGLEVWKENLFVSGILVRWQGEENSNSLRTAFFYLFLCQPYCPDTLNSIMISSLVEPLPRELYIQRNPGWWIDKKLTHISWV